MFKLRTVLVTALLLHLPAVVPLFADGAPDCVASNGSLTPSDAPHMTASAMSSEEVRMLEGFSVVGDRSLGEVLAANNVDITKFDVRSHVVIEAEGLDYEAFSLMKIEGAAFSGVFVFSPLPTVIRDELTRTGHDVPWSAMTFESGPSPGTMTLAMLGQGQPQSVNLLAEQSAGTVGERRVQSDISEGCVSCIVDLLRDIRCEAIAIAVTCATGIGCPGSIMSVLVKAVVGETTSITCSQLSILACAVRCSMPTITLSPGSNVTFAPSTINIAVSVTGGGSQLGNWVAVLRGTSVVQFFIGAGSSDVYRWSATAGTYRILAGNIPGLNGYLPPVAGMPWIKASSNIVVSAPNNAPAANFTFTTSGLTASFVDRSTDSDGTIATRSWNFGDGTSSTSTNPTKSYSSAGTRTVTLTVTDNGGKSSAKSLPVTVSQSSACSGNSYSGSLTQGSAQIQPNGNYYQTSRSGTHSGRLEGPSGADFDLYLYKWNGSQWGVVARATTTSNNEMVSYSGTAGYYYWVVSSYRGSGSYRLCMSQP